MLDSAISLGVPREAILIEPFSRTTVENVRCSMEILRTGNLLESLKTILLVSCPWHMGRILRIMKGAVPAHVRLLCCPQMRDCTENNWRECDECSRRVNAEAEFLDLLIRRGALPEYC